MHALARDFLNVAFVANGGIVDVAEAAAVARGEVPEGLLEESTTRRRPGPPPRFGTIGRQAHADPGGVLANADVAVFGARSNPRASRRELLERYAEYCAATKGRYGITKDGYEAPSLRHLMHPQNLFRGKTKRQAVATRGGRGTETVGARPSGERRGGAGEDLGVLADEVLDEPPGVGAGEEGGGGGAVNE